VLEDAVIFNLDFSGSGPVLLLNVPSFFEIERQKFLFKTKQTIH